jgi:hypothetical protein
LLDNLLPARIILKQGVCHIVALPFTFLEKKKGILRQKKNDEKFKYFTMQK